MSTAPPTAAELRYRRSFEAVPDGSEPFVIHPAGLRDIPGDRLVGSDNSSGTALHPKIGFSGPVVTRRSARPFASTPTWQEELRLRLSSHWLIKTTVIPVFVAAFFVAYFQLLRHPLFPVAIMPLGLVDRLVSFQPFALLPYASLWLYAFLAPALVRGRREMIVYASEVMTLTVVGLGTFLLWPTAIPPRDFDHSSYPLFAFLNRIDAAGNACPSLHVAFAIFTAIWLARLLRAATVPCGAHLLNAGWCSAIVYSTMASRQHVALDVLAGVTLGAAAALFDPRVTANALCSGAPRLNRQSLALLIAVLGKLTIVALHLQHSAPLVAAVLFLGPDLWILTGLLLPNTSCLIPTATRFRTTRREVWLTIDDGPDPSTTIPMLDLLDRHAVKATFFVIGQQAASYPALVAEMIERGHAVGNHTQTHPLRAFWLAGPRRTSREIDACQAVLTAAAGGAEGWFRPPAGIKTFFLRRTLTRRGMILIGWSARAREHGSASIEQPLRRLKNQIRPGAILLVHESKQHGEQRVALLSALLDHLAATGYRCVLPKRDALE